MKNYTQKDYYKILGLNFDATNEDIKKAFKRAVIKYHPDINQNGEKIFLEIKEAYDVLSDETERKNYDFIRGYDILKKQKSYREKFEKNKNSTEQFKKTNENKYKYQYGNEYEKTKSASDYKNHQIKSKKIITIFKIKF
ncbi:J domain-containing protein [bacterium]|nr:J domain-containing protein [bacterium]